MVIPREVVIDPVETTRRPHKIIVGEDIVQALGKSRGEPEQGIRGGICGWKINIYKKVLSSFES